MHAPLRAFLEHLIDYAGMFPPARLAMPEALRLYTEYAAGPDAWMLGRFVCRADQLDALRHLAGAPPALAVTALGRGGGDMAELIANLAADLRDIACFRDAGGSVDAIELPLFGPLSREAAERILLPLAAAGLRTFFEVPPAALADSTPFAERLADRSSDPLAFGLKVRCGGTAVPTIEQLAAFICRCRDRRMPWKATAGLHHPLRHFDVGLQVPVHGFVNVFAAGILAHYHPLDAAQVAAILAEESPAAFRFSADAFGWRDWSCTAAQVREARRWVPSFGSCSYDEPRADLQALGWLENGPHKGYTSRGHE